VEEVSSVSLGSGPHAGHQVLSPCADRGNAMPTLEGIGNILRRLYKSVGVRRKEMIERWEDEYDAAGGNSAALKFRVCNGLISEGNRDSAVESPPPPPRRPHRQPPQRSTQSTYPLGTSYVGPPVSTTRVWADDDISEVLYKEPYPRGWPDNLDYIPAHLRSR